MWAAAAPHVATAHAPIFGIKPTIDLPKASIGLPMVRSGLLGPSRVIVLSSPTLASRAPAATPDREAATWVAPPATDASTGPAPGRVVTQLSAATPVAASSVPNCLTATLPSPTRDCQTLMALLSRACDCSKVRPILAALSAVTLLLSLMLWRPSRSMPMRSSISATAGPASVPRAAPSLNGVASSAPMFRSVPTRSTPPDSVAAMEKPSFSAAGASCASTDLSAVPASAPWMPMVLSTPSAADTWPSGTSKLAAEPATFLNPSPSCPRSSKAKNCCVDTMTSASRVSSVRASAV